MSYIKLNLAVKKIIRNKGELWRAVQNVDILGQAIKKFKEGFINAKIYSIRNRKQYILSDA
jgi:hypothetical protein